MALFNDYKEMVRSGVIGHAIGDALGVPVEFSYRGTLKKHPVKDMTGYGVHDVPAGTWSDDTSMEIALMQSLIDKGRFDYDDIMKNFVRWTHGEFTATGKMFDIGGTCSQAISNYRYGDAPLDCGIKTGHCNGNGSLMRILPVALICYHNHIDKDQDRYALVRDVSSLTHAHEISVLGCYIYVNYICHLLDGDSLTEAYDKMQRHNYLMFSDQARAEYDRVLNGDIYICDEYEIESGGYVRDSLEAALWCLLNNKTYHETVLAAVNLGDDTDTVAAIAGSMAGLYYGYNGMPIKWIFGLGRYEYLLDLCDKFAETDISV